MKGELLSATGNRFVLLDLRAEADASAWLAPPAGWLAAALGAPRSAPAADGLLLVLEAGSAADLRMVLVNRDGSRPEACGNGLRCIGDWATRAGLENGGKLRVATDSGVRELEIRRAQGAVRVKAHLGAARVLARDEPLRVGGEEVRATLVDVGNPHCVVFVDALERPPIRLWGPRLERHPRFQGRTNVELVAREPSGLAMRVWERGVGETRACGTGACAAAVAAAERCDLDWPIGVRCTGGVLVVDRDERGELWLEGEVEVLGDVEVHRPG